MRQFALHTTRFIVLVFTMACSAVAGHSSSSESLESQIQGVRAARMLAPAALDQLTEGSLPNTTIIGKNYLQGERQEAIIQGLTDGTYAIPPRVHLVVSDGSAKGPFIHYEPRSGRDLTTDDLLYLMEHTGFKPENVDEVWLLICDLARRQFAQQFADLVGVTVRAYEGEVDAEALKLGGRQSIKSRLMHPSITPAIRESLNDVAREIADHLMSNAEPYVRWQLRPHQLAEVLPMVNVYLGNSELRGHTLMYRKTRSERFPLQWAIKVGDSASGSFVEYSTKNALQDQLRAMFNAQ